MSQQYKVPQNIDMEDKVVGPFTMKQFAYLMGGGLLIYAIFQTLVDYENGMVYTVLLGLPIGLLALALTFIKINDRPFEYFLKNMTSFLFAPKKRIWQRGYEVPKLVISTPVKQQVSTSTDAQKKAALDDIARNLEYSAGNMGISGNRGQRTENGQAPNQQPAIAGQVPSAIQQS